MPKASSHGAEPEPQTESPSEQGLWRKYEARARARIESATSAAASRRPQSQLVDTAFRVYERNRILPASLLVGALASRIVILLIPLLALIIFSFGLYGDLTDNSAAEAARDAGIAGIFARAADDSASVSEGVRVAALIATTFAMLYAANGVGRLVRRSTALIWGVPYSRMSRPWALPLVVIAISGLGWLLSALGSLSEEWNLEYTVGALVVELVTLVFVWLVVSRLLPHDPLATRWSNFLPGAFFLAGGVVALRVAMVLYFAPASVHLSERYGSIGVALVLLTWAYWLGMIIVGSAEINAALHRGRETRVTQR